MEKAKKISNLGTPSLIAIYITNTLLLIGFLALCVFVMVIGLWGSLYALGSLNNGGAIYLTVFILVLFWFLASFVCFISVMFIAGAKKRWSWILQFLPFMTAGIVYLLLHLVAYLLRQSS